MPADARIPPLFQIFLLRRNASNFSLPNRLTVITLRDACCLRQASKRRPVHLLCGESSHKSVDGRESEKKQLSPTRHLEKPFNIAFRDTRSNAQSMKRHHRRSPSTLQHVRHTIATSFGHSVLVCRLNMSKRALPSSVLAISASSHVRQPSE